MELLFPHNNEEQLIQEAHMLGHKKILLCYNNTLPKKPYLTQGVEHAIIVKDKKDIVQAKKQTKHVFGLAERSFFEDKRISGIVHVGLNEKKDHTHYRRSLTQVEDALAKAQGKTIYFLFSDVLHAKKPTELLGRWHQDKKTLRKATAQLVSGATNRFELRSKKDLKAFWNTL